MVIPEPREHLRNLVAIKIHASDCGCKHFRPDGSDADDAYYRRHADAVMELFPEVRVEDSLITEGWTVPGCIVEKVTHRQYVLRTAPEPLVEPVPVEETR